MAKKYSTADSGKFVNGILGTYLRSYAPATRISADVGDTPPSADEAAA